MSLRFIGPALCAGLLMSAAVTPATAVTSCSPTKMKILVTSSGTVSTSSTTFVAIPGASFSFIQGGTKAGCVVVRFSAASSVNGGGVSHVQAVLDNVTPADPGSVSFSGANVGSVSHAYEFLFASVEPGPHTVRMMYRVSNGSNQVFIDERTTVVQSVP